MRGLLGPETSKLVAEVAGLRRALDETPDARLVRLAADPVAVFAALNMRGGHAPLPQAIHPEARARIAEALVPATEATTTSKHGPAKVLHGLKATAPALILPVCNEEKISPFQPTAADVSEAIDVVRIGRYFPVVSMTAAITTAFLLWLLI